MFKNKILEHNNVARLEFAKELCVNRIIPIFRLLKILKTDQFKFNATLTELKKLLSTKYTLIPHGNAIPREKTIKSNRIDVNEAMQISDIHEIAKKLNGLIIYKSPDKDVSRDLKMTAIMNNRKLRIVLLDKNRPRQLYFDDVCIADKRSTNPVLIKKAYRIIKQFAYTIRRKDIILENYNVVNITRESLKNYINLVKTENNDSDKIKSSTTLTPEIVRCILEQHNDYKTHISFERKFTVKDMLVVKS